MKKLKPALVFGFLGIATFASLVGTVSGTLAWYAYNSRATLSYSGTSVENSVQLQIGLACAHQMPTSGSNDLDEFARVMGLLEENPKNPEVVDGVYYYFAPLGYGLNSSVINAYLKEFGYATTELCPVTTGYYDSDPSKNTGFSLKNGPKVDHPATDVAADKTNYLKLPFAFKASDSITETAHYIEGAEIWLTDAKGAASSNHDGDVYQAMRVFFDRVNKTSPSDTNPCAYDSDFMVNPTASVSGENKVGGVLDLTADGYYDHDGNKEIIFGEWDKTALADPTTLLSADGYVNPDGGAPYYDLNNTGDIVPNGNNFNARHHAGVKYYTYNNLNSIPFRTAKYESLNAVKPARDAKTGKLSNPLVPVLDNNGNPVLDENNDPVMETKVTSVCKTAGIDDGYIGRVDAYIWLEGWDYHVVDKEQFHAFDFGLTFEINKVGNNS